MFKNNEDNLRKEVERLEGLFKAREAELKDVKKRLEKELIERAESEKAMRESEEKYRTLIENTNDIIYSMDAGGVISFVSPQCKIAGYKPADVIGHNITDFVHPDDLERVMADLKRSIETAEEFPTQFRLKKKDGGYINVEEMARLSKEDGKVVRFTGVVRDITSRIDTEQRLQRTEEGLNEAQRIARLGSWDWNVKTGEIWWSSEAYRIFGIAPESGRVMLEKFLSVVHPEDREFVRNAINDALHKKEPYSIDHSIILPGGQERIVHEEAEVTYDESGAPVRMVGTVQDITERKVMEDEIRKHRDHLEELVNERAAEIKKTNEQLELEIAERKRSEDALRESRESFRTIFIDSPVALVEEDYSEIKKHIDGLRGQGINDLKIYFASRPGAVEDAVGMVKVLNANKQALMLCGAIDNNELQNSLRRIFTPTFYEGFRETIVALSQGKLITEHEAELHTLSGEKRFVSRKICIVSGHEATWSKVLISLVDITERKFAEEALIISEANYRAIFDTANDGIFVFDISSGDIIDVNRKGSEMFIYTHDEMKRLNIQYLISDEPPFTKDNMAGLLKRAAQGERQLFEWVAKDRAGRHFWIEMNLRRAIIGSRYCLLAVVRDITERKRTEEILRESEELLRKVLETMPVGVWLLDKDARITRGNTAAQEIWGAKKPIAAGEKFECRGWWVKTGKRIEPNECGAHRALEKGEISISEEIELECMDGSHKIILSSAIPIRSAHDEIIGAIVVIQDITARKLDEEASTRLATIIEATSDITMIFDKEGRILYINKSGKKMLGLHKKEYIAGARIYDYHTEWANKVISSEAIPTAMEKGVWTGETALLGRGRKETAVSQVIIAHKGRGSSIDFFASIIRDITDRKAMEQRIRETLVKYRTVVDTFDGYIYICSEKFKIEFMNRRLMEKFGRDATGESYYKIIYGRSKPCPWCLTKKGLKKKARREEFKSPVDGRWYYLVYTPIYHPDNTVSNMVMVQDITERKLIEEQIEHLASFPQLNPTPIIELNTTGAIRFANTATLDILGKLGIKKDARAFLPDDIGKILKAMNGKKKEQFYREKRIANSFFGEYIHLVPQFGAARIYVEDITQRKETEKKIIELNQELVKSNDLLKQLALKDSHTGLYNHRYLQGALEAEFSRAKRTSSPLSVIMMDIDYFKSINDVYGHQFGDLVLRQFANHLKNIVRIYDIVIRFGGEEFIIIAPGADRVGGMHLAKRVLSKIMSSPFGNKKHSVKIKLSLAVSSYPDDNIAKCMDLITLADRVLNKAKEEGGHRVGSSLDIRKAKGYGWAEDEYGSKDAALLKDKISKLTKRSNQSLIEAISAFAKTIELKDAYTGEHVEKTVYYATEIARRVGLPPHEIDWVKQAAVLHDLGKIGISEKILLKRSKLTKSEFEEIKKHPQIGVDIIRPIQFMRDIIPLILYHHEKWDGTGYPRGLKGEEIPIGARIISVADAYHALISNRPYRKAFTKKKAVDVIKKASGTQFDPKVVAVFLKVVKRDK